MIGTIQTWVVHCDYPGCVNKIKMDNKHDLETAMTITNWKIADSKKTYCYDHAQSNKKFKLEHSKEKLVYVHSSLLCSGRPCPIHNRTEHNMRSFPQHWRSDRQFMERICPHGIGHPDPDQRQFLIDTMGKKGQKAEFVHGCDGCCTRSTNAVVF